MTCKFENKRKKEREKMQRLIGRRDSAVKPTNCSPVTPTLTQPYTRPKWEKWVQCDLFQNKAPEKKKKQPGIRYCKVQDCVLVLHVDLQTGLNVFCSFFSVFFYFIFVYDKLVYAVSFCLHSPFNCISFHKFSWQLSALFARRRFWCASKTNAIRDTSSWCDVSYIFWNWNSVPYEVGDEGSCLT